MASLQDDPGPRRQGELYTAAMPPAVPADAEALVARSRERLSPEAFAYVDGGAGSGDTMRANRAALDRWRIRPRLGRDVSTTDIGVGLFGRMLPTPILAAPLGVQEMAHAEADLATARACATIGVPMVFSTQASVAMEHSAAGMGDGQRWFQLYWSCSDALVTSLVQRAEACGCAAIMVTLDTPLLGWRPADLDLAHLPFLRGRGIANYLSDAVFRRMLDRPPEEDMVGAIRLFTRIFANPAFAWTKLALLRRVTRLPVLVKGITHPDDARIALDHGVDGIVVSNHGGRQVDGAVAAADALDDIAPIVKGRVPLLFDSGIRGGADIFRALALGADAVMIGRPIFHGLAIAGEAGVRDVLANMLAEFDLTMRLAGCTTVAAIDRAMIRREDRPA